jgi:hypothetical protein
MYEKFGVIKKDCYVREVNGRHFFRKYQGFGISLDVLHELVELKVKKVVFIYTTAKNGKEVYSTTLQAFLESDLEFDNGEEDLQRFVRIKEMQGD